MTLNNDLQKKLSKQYEPSALVSMKSRGQDISFKTDEKGNPVLLFVGRANPEGHIKGDRYARVLKYDPDGNKIKGHWELKGKAT